MTPARSAALAQGLIAGMIGYSVFVLFFAITNFIAGESVFTTADLLGRALFSFGDSANPAAPIIAYNGVHLVASLGTGLIASFLVLEVDLHPHLWYIVMFIFMAGLLYSVAVGGVVANEIAGAVSWAEVVIVNIAAAALSGGYLWKAHPRLRDRVRRVTD